MLHLQSLRIPGVFILTVAEQTPLAPRQVHGLEKDKVAE